MNIQIGPMHAASFDEDSKHLGFVLARYKFVARMLQGFETVLEVGCGDCTGARVVQPAVGYLHGIDVREYTPPRVITTSVWDMTERPYNPITNFWEAIYALDVLEHIPVEKERAFIANIAQSLTSNGGVFICGTPSLESQAYASENSKREHVNCKTEQGLRETLSPYFHPVFMFGMNDETLHTGFGPMQHYRLALCVRRP